MPVGISPISPPPFDLSSVHDDSSVQLQSSQSSAMSNPHKARKPKQKLTKARAASGVVYFVERNEGTC